MGKTYKTMQGKEVDMEKLMRQNELMPAVGNISVNARGDELGSGGKIVRKREDLVSDYYENNPKVINKEKSGIIEANDPTASVLSAGLSNKRNK